MNLCPHQVIHLEKALVKRSLVHGFVEIVIKKHHQGIWKLVLTIRSHVVFVRSSIMQFLKMLNLIFTSTESSNIVNVN